MSMPDDSGFHEVVLYCASRLRAASIVILNAAESIKELHQSLVIELVRKQFRSILLQSSVDLFFLKQFTLSYIGMSTALGHSVEIPIIIRQLASILHSHGTGDLPQPFNRDFIVSLDAGTDPDDLAAVASSYHNQWWTDHFPPRPDCHLSLGTLEACLQHHRKETGIKEILPATLMKTAYTWSRHVTGLKGATLPECQRCRLYRGVALSLRDNLQDLHRHATAVAITQEYDADSFSRRANIMFQLYEAAAAKEANVPALRTITPASSKGKKSTKTLANQSAATATAELKRLQTLPDVKWTWGAALTKEDVAAAVCPPTHSGRIHSGYVNSLPDDSRGSDSDGNDTVGSKPVFSDVSQDIMQMQDLASQDYPHHFCYPPLRHDHGHGDDLPPSEDQRAADLQYVSAWVDIGRSDGKYHNL